MIECVLVCGQCGIESDEVEEYRQNTQYRNQAMNMATLCPECKAENDEYWADMWGNYYSACM